MLKLMIAGLIGLFDGLSANAQSVLITEIFPDPAPIIGLPGSEFIELTNVSSTTIDLLNWKISDGSSTARISSSFLLKPDSSVIICPSSSIINWEPFGRTIGVSSCPSLNNDGDFLILYSPDGKLVHALSYSIEWYKNDVKALGGWTLEMIDKNNPCTGFDNWTASVDPFGGTPGKINSVNASNPDEEAPQLLRTWYVDSVSLIVLFNESLDSLTGATTLNYQFSNGLEVQSAIPRPPLFNEVLIRLKQKPDSNLVYDLTVRSVSDCSGNSIGSFNKAKFAVPGLPSKNEIVINEILFNPKPDGFDYVEIYNAGKKTVDLSKLYAGINRITAEPLLFFPGDFLVITENRNWVMNNYFVKEPEHLIQISNLPSLPDDKGILSLLNEQGNVLDEVSYDDAWHFALIGDKDGVALERIDYRKPAQDKSNWTSAASTAGFGTPTARNSQFLTDPQLQSAITVSPRIFSPDNDGHDDIATIYYQNNEPGYVINITVFDAKGRLVRALIRNSTVSQRAEFRWDGLDDQQRGLPIGVYIFYSEIFNLKGKVSRFKNTITLARKF